MIPLRELRLGSYVMAAGQIHTIRAIPCNHLYEPIKLLDLTGARLEVNGPGKIDPVPVTSELLYRCGFGHKRSTNIEGMYEYEYHPQPDTSPLRSPILLCTVNGETIIYKNLEIIGRRYLKSLHVLQSLFWSLTGEELTLAP